jgi:hypothetical protein
VTLPVEINPHLLGSAAGGYQIERSLRFNSADSAYLSRTPGSAPTAATKGTWSFWIKGRKLATEEYVFGSRDGGNSASTFLRFESGDTLRFYNHNGSSVTWNIITTQVFRDPGSWMHIVIALDTTQATDTNRVKFYVNGVQVTAFGTASYPAQNATMTRWAANGIPNYIGNEGTTPGNYGDYYLTETYYIDGQQLSPTDFGEFNSDTGVWQPIEYTGTYGTNGFYLDFSDNSGTTSTTLGKDQAGSNNWTPNNFSVTAGAGNDSLVDSPTRYGTDTGAGGEVRGNYCTLNPLNADGSVTVTNGNLAVSVALGASAFRAITGTIGVSSGKWYWEVTCQTSGGHQVIGVATTSFGKQGQYVGQTSTSYGYYAVTGNKINNNSSVSYGATYTLNDIIGVALDMDAGTLTFYKNGASQGQAYSGLSGSFVAAFSNDGGTTANADATFNFGQRPFAYTAPSGFKALVTTNLPTPTIADGGEYFDATTYTGNNSSLTITNSGFQPDFLWIKSRSNAQHHVLIDAVRGVTKVLNSNQTLAELTNTANTGVISFNSNGFSLNGEQTVDGGVNTNTYTYVGWQWKAGGSVSANNNTDGTITSTVSANPDAGFSIVTWIANGSNADGVGHGLGVAPKIVIYKIRNGTSSWYVWTTAINGSNYEVYLNQTGVGGAVSASYGNITSTTISNYGFGAGDNMVAYCFAPVSGYSAFGSYTGNGNADGPFVFTGFRPKFVMWKNTSAAEGWLIEDGVRSPYNQVALELYPHSTNVEAAGSSRSPTQQFDFLSNGFKVRGAQEQTNGSGNTIIYAAFAENPFAYALAR